MTTIYFIFLLNIYIVCNAIAFTTPSDDPMIYMDHLKEDDHGEFELSDIIALSQQTLETSGHPPIGEEKLFAAEIHNAYRRNWTYPLVEGSELAYLEYNNTLTWTASLWALGCDYSHAFSEEDNMTMPAMEQGQCLYRGAAYTLSRGIYLMYHIELEWWYFNNHSCWEPRTKYMCGHIFQIMMGKTEHIGVYRVFGCFPRWPDMYYTVWHYYKGVTDTGKSVMIYKYGPVCSRCRPGYQCAMNMCIPQPERVCQAYNLDCECVRNCMNCGTPDWKNCRCNCKLGWDWPDCSFPCQDRDDVLEKSRWCKRNARVCKRKDHEEVRAREFECRAVCKMCPVVPKKAPPDQLCCEGKICEAFYALDTNTCECNMLCPSDVCMYHSNVTALYPSTTTTAITTTTTPTAATTTTSTTSIQTTVISTTTKKSLTKQESLSTTSTPKIQPTVIGTTTENSLTKEESLSSKKQSTISRTGTTTSKNFPTAASTTVSETSTNEKESRPTSATLVAVLHPEIFLIAFIFILIA